MILADLSDPLGNYVKRELPDSDLIRRLFWELDGSPPHVEGSRGYNGQHCPRKLDVMGPWQGGGRRPEATWVRPTGAARRRLENIPAKANKAHQPRSP